MEPKLHRRVQRYGWDMAVQDYDQYFVPLLRHCSERCLALLDLQPGERVLDVATGTGIAAFLAAEIVGPEGAVVATDISQRMVDATRAEAERRGIVNMQCEREDAEELSHADASFAAVSCVLGLMYPADPQRAIAQMQRVLRPGGRAAVAVWGRRDRCGWASIFPIVDSRVESDVCPLFFQLGAPGALSYAFQKAGFVDLHEERVDRPLCFAGERDVLAAVFAGGPVALAYSKFSPETREAAHREFLESISEYRRGDGYEVPGEFVFMLARKPVLSEAEGL
ncbi:MAG: methyltransferase domain-containing protein [Dehalococcoidia bacterium]|nr:methyltransferase domain-containing protein [Dehalococcoidia bacterium]